MSGPIIYGLVITLHVLVALFLIIVILIQGGRGGMGEALGGAAAQSLFGGSANIVMAKVTAVCAGLFIVTCLSLAKLSSERGGSVIDQLPISPEQLPATLPKHVRPTVAQPKPATTPSSAQARTEPTKPVSPDTAQGSAPSQPSP